MGTNPISVAAPGKDGDSFVLDMATSSVALGKVSAMLTWRGWKYCKHFLAGYRLYSHPHNNDDDDDDDFCTV